MVLKKNELVVPVIIIGGGPAGAATAITLCRQQVSCMVVEESESPVFKPGETLPPNAGPLLRNLGVWDIVCNEAHEACTGNLVYWGMDTVQTRPFFAEPHGDGWHLNRPVFEEQLRVAAIEKGAAWLSGWRCSGVHYEENKWRITCEKKNGETKFLDAAFLIDATGRPARIARMMGVNRNSIDTLTGYYVTLASAPSMLTGATFIEAVEDGWWYAAPLKTDRLVINFMTDAGLHKISPGVLPVWLFEKIQQTRHLKKYLPHCNAADFATALIKPASTSLLENITGNGWLAVGDAAFSYDPISSYGITAALGGGIYAGYAIADWLKGKKEALDAYTLVQQQAFDNCLAMLRYQYNLERRWPASTFWQQRHIV